MEFDSRVSAQGLVIELGLKVSCSTRLGFQLQI